MGKIRLRNKENANMEKIEEKLNKKPEYINVI